MKKLIFPALLLILLGCSGTKTQELVQISTIDALLQGVYDGNTSLQTLSENGNFGIGTLNGLDGELILLDGNFYQVRDDGKIYQPELSACSPFASVTYFNPEKELQVEALSFIGLKTKINSLMPGSNLFFGIKLSGNFTSVKTRSVPKQQQPYPPLVEVTANQPEFEATNVSGTLVGFYCPPYVTGLNVPGYHLHFLSGEKDFGGHLLAFELESGTLHLDQINNFKLNLPEDEHFLNTTLDKDLSDDLKQVEGE
ncbi:acetolactate decarboxylase [uncultured Draconibacterium sp.]|uniref:acetolactate decarboxylase n=1 Tax=uncultured Draconibacterium sp. TaxID=1573823 RepID=UPI0029C694B7|nr:acetolactate decarboxylase [uncultured Draconibacterium sp.]